MPRPANTTKKTPPKAAKGSRGDAKRDSIGNAATGGDSIPLDLLQIILAPEEIRKSPDAEALILLETRRRHPAAIKLLVAELLKGSSSQCGDSIEVATTRAERAYSRADVILAGLSHQIAEAFARNSNDLEAPILGDWARLDKETAEALRIDAKGWFVNFIASKKNGTPGYGIDPETIALDFRALRERDSAAGVRRSRDILFDELAEKHSISVFTVKSYVDDLAKKKRSSAVIQTPVKLQT